MEVQVQPDGGCSLDGPSILSIKADRDQGFIPRCILGLIHLPGSRKEEAGSRKPCTGYCGYF
ncbi:hypothetical protein EYF80_054869 [Liparis tanakae]|uniref:Uncharacterized protein n=1 Tax=Liparis tanakae TaxID=230148 RepID=A0A4Z2F187_9TELE|nr:hypothetical protein EYF80_054869 [Liparis tanakae]